MPGQADRCSGDSGESAPAKGRQAAASVDTEGAVMEMRALSEDKEFVGESDPVGQFGSH